MKLNRRITNRTVLLTAIIGSLLIVALITVNSLWVSRSTLSATDEAVSAVSSFYLETLAEQRANTVMSQINVDFNQMEKAISFIQDENVSSKDELRAAIGKVKDLLSLKSFALADENNVVYTQYTTYTGGSRYDFLSQERMEDRLISTVYLYDTSRQLLLAMPTPDLTINGKRIKACFMRIDVRDIIELLSPNEDDKTYFALYTSNGENLSGNKLGPVIADKNFLDATASLVSQDVWEQTVDNFAEGISGSLSFTSSGVEETVRYVPVIGPGWELAVSIRESVITDQFRGITEKNLSLARNQIALTLAAVLVLVGILGVEVWQLNKNKLEAEKAASKSFQTMANTDSLTGVRNKHAYSELESHIDRQIKDGTISKLAVVVCDINGLKHVNDTLGHAAGDKLIKEASKLICKSFKQGAVFRVGGDEFAVLLQGEGYDTMLDALGRFNQQVEENIQNQAVVVAAGYDMLGPSDKTLNDVFVRADEMMYERKKQLKAMGAETRE
ncbi:MAG: diguanylate cyclase [Coriobacteriales bacterium]|nr:diguanylate cyclase [Coriobacteriales bacterium]